ncbi:TPA: helix-turn-helix transcriptional regulator [Yersinia enterocolitica]
MNRICEYRGKAGLSQKNFAELMGVTQSAIGHYETGRRTPNISVCKRIVACLGSVGIECDLGDLFPNDTTQD